MYFLLGAFIVVIATLDVACSCWQPFLFPRTSWLFIFVVFVGATVVTAVVVVVVVVVVVAAPLLFFIHVDPASWLLILWPCVNR